MNPLLWGTTALCAFLPPLSSHREAPFVTEHPKVDATDFYAFTSYEAGREDYVTLIANYLPLQDPERAKASLAVALELGMRAIWIGSDAIDGRAPSHIDSPVCADSSGLGNVDRFGS